MDEEEIYRGQIEPSWSRRFNVVEITEEVKQLTKKFFEDREYSPEEGYSMSCELSRLVRDSVMKKKDKLRIPRFKISAQVFLGQKKDQKISIVAKGYWDNYVDNYCTYTYETDVFFCSVLVFGFYTD